MGDARWYALYILAAIVVSAGLLTRQLAEACWLELPFPQSGCEHRQQARLVLVRLMVLVASGRWGFDTDPAVSGRVAGPTWKLDPSDPQCKLLAECVHLSTKQHR